MKHVLSRFGWFFVLASVCLWPMAASADAGDDLLLFLAPMTAVRCTFGLEAARLDFGTSGGGQSVAVTASRAGCSWVAQAPSEATTWLTASPGGTGSGTVTVTTTANDAYDARSAVILVAGKELVVTQAGGVRTTYALPDSGQTKCYNNSREDMCSWPGDDFYGQDGNFEGAPLTCQASGETVTDAATGLIWQQADDGTSRTWDDAVSYCQALPLGGHSDWRLPSRKELLTLVDAGRTHPALDPALSAASKPYWTATDGFADASSAWFVNFGSGYSDYRKKTLAVYVRCVRGGPLPTSTYADNGDGTVSDQVTGLMWEKAPTSAAKYWQPALAYCGTLGTGGYTDWRLPNKRELEILVDESRQWPAIAPLFAESGNDYWSGTTFVDDNTQAWRVNFAYGFSMSAGKTSSSFIRCVRGGLPH